MPENRKHLLLVEDEAPLREALAERLAEHGFDVEQADTGEQALERLAEFAYDVVIADLRLPGVDGTRVLEDALSRYPDIIGIIVTGYGTVKDAVEAIKRGAADFVTKPFQFDELLHALGSALRAAAAEVGERLPAIAAPGTLQVRGHRGTQPRDARPVPAARNGRGHGEHHPDHGRDRNGQGAGGARDSPEQPAPARSTSSR